MTNPEPVETWTSLGTTADRWSETREILVRPWRPGDGLACSHAAVQRREPCGPPAVISETIDESTSSAKWRPPVRRVRRVLCAGHFAGLVAGHDWKPWKIRKAAEDEAKEAVLAAHWSEFQSEYRTRLDAAKTEQLNKIPEGLREVLAAIDWDAMPAEGEAH